jgi:hypothetical protein
MKYPGGLDINSKVCKKQAENITKSNLLAYGFIPEVTIKDGSRRIFLTTDH